jgi:hypothetical protein
LVCCNVYRFYHCCTCLLIHDDETVLVCCNVYRFYHCCTCLLIHDNETVLVCCNVYRFYHCCTCLLIHDDETVLVCCNVYRFYHCCLFLGDRTHLSDINIFNLIPDSRHYMTYDGSLSQPGCQETVTWIIINRPIIIDRQQVCAISSIFANE